MKPPRTFVLTVDRQLDCFDATAAHLSGLGIEWERYLCIDRDVCKLIPVETYDHDRPGERIAGKDIVAILSHYMLWKVMLYQPDDSFWSLEYDVEFVPDWQEKYDEAMSIIPDDWDVVFLGSCCAMDKPKQHLRGNVWEVKYPFCGHAMMFRKKALHILLREHQRIYAKLDIAMAWHSLPHLRTYTILPRIANQRNTPLHE